MFLEHIVWSLAIALPVVMCMRQPMFGRYTALIVVSGCIPDLDGIIDLIPYLFSWQQGIETVFLHHRYFHSLGFLFLYALFAGVLLNRKGWDLHISLLLSAIGAGAHLLEDCLVYNPAGAFLWPFSSQMIGIGIFPSYSRDFLSIANTEVLIIGFSLVLTAMLGTHTVQRLGWIPREEELQPFPLLCRIPRLEPVWAAFITTIREEKDSCPDTVVEEAITVD